MITFVTNTHADPTQADAVEAVLRRHTTQVARLGLRRVYFAGVLPSSATAETVRAALPEIDLQIAYVIPPVKEAG